MDGWKKMVWFRELPVRRTKMIDQVSEPGARDDRHIPNSRAALKLLM